MPKLKIGEDVLQCRLDLVKSLVAQPISALPISDPEPTLIGGCVLVGNKYHAANVEQLVRLGVNAVLNCASAGISKLPLDQFETRGIRYAFTNVQDHHQYPILHDKDGVHSKHLEVANELYMDIEETGGKVLFFCVAGQNRSAALAIACLMLRGQPLEDILKRCSKCRPFILENVGFQRQLVEMEALLGEELDLAHCPAWKKPKVDESRRHIVQALVDSCSVEVELLVPGLVTMEVKIPIKSTIASVKAILINHVNRHLLAYSDTPAHVAKSWVVLASFGHDEKCDFPLEEEAIAPSVQVARMRSMFGLTVVEEGSNSIVHWSAKCRFALVIFSVVGEEEHPVQLPWFFKHIERPGAPATLLENTLRSTHLRAWDFETGQAFDSTEPIVFSFGEGTNDKRAFMNISKSNQAPQQFNAPGEGGILGMGSNAIVHRVELRPTSSKEGACDPMECSTSTEQNLDAAVKRAFTLSKMVASLESKSEAGMAKRLRLANSLNKQGRVLYFYGLGVALSSNSKNHEEYKFEAVLLSRHQEQFSSYTMKKFMADYTTPPHRAPPEVQAAVQQMHADFSLIKVKELLVSLLSAFRDLTLMGVQAFDFNHLNNVLISRDYRMVRLIDIDGNSRGSIQVPWGRTAGKPDHPAAQPALEVDLHTHLPVVVQQLILGKGRGALFVTDIVRQIWQAKDDEDAKGIIKNVILDDFYPTTVPGTEDHVSVEKHVFKLAEWLYALLKKRIPWNNWTNDIYDAMRCIDHLPIA